jgi:hypothetical protein
MCEPSEEYHIFCMIKSRPFEPGFIANTLLFEYNTPFDAEKVEAASSTSISRIDTIQAEQIKEDCL